MPELLLDAFDPPVELLLLVPLVLLLDVDWLLFMPDVVFCVLVVVALPELLLLPTIV
jgi:hypothetical protein